MGILIFPENSFARCIFDLRLCIRPIIFKVRFGHVFIVVVIVVPEIVVSSDLILMGYSVRNLARTFPVGTSWSNDVKTTLSNAINVISTSFDHDVPAGLGLNKNSTVATTRGFHR